jgi:hypothetical protein
MAGRVAKAEGPRFAYRWFSGLGESLFIDHFIHTCSFKIELNIRPPVKKCVAGKPQIIRKNVLVIMIMMMFTMFQKMIQMP